MNEPVETTDILASVKSELDQIDSLPVGEHAQHLESVHRTLESALSTIDGL
jgi:hypothetical protein